MYDKTAKSKSSNTTYACTCLSMSTPTLEIDPSNFNLPISRKKETKTVDPPNATNRQCFNPYSNAFSFFKLLQIPLCLLVGLFVVVNYKQQKFHAFLFVHKTVQGSYPNQPDTFGPKAFIRCLDNLNWLENLRLRLHEDALGKNTNFCCVFTLVFVFTQ